MHIDKLFQPLQIKQEITLKESVQKDIVNIDEKV